MFSFTFWRAQRAQCLRAFPVVLLVQEFYKISFAHQATPATLDIECELSITADLVGIASVNPHAKW